MDSTESTWNEFKEFISKNINYKFFFRGQSDSQWELKTSFHRNAQGKNILLTHYFREIIHNVNLQISAIEKPIDISNPVEIGVFLTRLQHHGFPTPLLDWTLSPYIAAYFAFKDVPQITSKEKNIAIYIFDIDSWMTELEPKNDPHGSDDYLCKFVTYSTGNPRMSRQMAVTTITNVLRLEDFIFRKSAEKNTCFLKKFNISVLERNTVMQELDLMGINDMTMFPDLDGMCKYLKEIHFNKDIVIPPPPPPLITPPF